VWFVFYIDTKAGNIFYVIFSVIAFIILVYALGSLLLLYESIYRSASNIGGVPKLILLKLSVGIIVIESLVEQFLYVFHALPNNVTATDHSHYGEEYKAQRGYCFLVLLEFTLLSVATYLAYSRKITALPPQATGDGLPAVTSSSSHGDQDTPPDMSFGGFVCAVLNFRDVFGVVGIAADGMKQELMERNTNTSKA